MQKTRYYNNLGLGRWQEKVIVYKSYESVGSVITARLYINFKQDFFLKKKTKAYKKLLKSNHPEPIATESIYQPMIENC